MLSIKNMKISRSIMIAVLVPLLMALFFASQVAMREISVSKDLKNLETLTNLSVKMSSLVHEQQKERGATAVFLGSKGTKFRSELKAQRQETNKKRQEFKEYVGSFNAKIYDTEFNKKFDALLSSLEKMDNIRASVSSLSISPKKAISYYTGLNGQNISLIGYMAILSPDPTIVVGVVGYTNFLQGKERAGVERAVGANGFASGKFTPPAMDKFKNLISAQATYNGVFLSYATETQRKIYHEVMDGAAAKNVNKMRKIALSGGLEGNLQGIEGKYWFDTITKKINGLKKIENSLSEDLKKSMSVILKNATRKVTVALAVAAIAIIVTVLLSLAIIRILTRAFDGIVVATSELATGDLNTAIPERTNNEIGEIVDALAVFKSNLLETENLKKKQEEVEKRSEEEKRQAMQDIANDFENQVGGIITHISNSSSEMEGTANLLSSTAKEASTQAIAVAAASEEASTNVQTVAAATEEMSASIKEIAEQINRTNETASEAVKKADHTNSTIEELHKASNQIGEVVSMINDIAEQTNLLALNATIEAARAGDAGKGFAVVASEVKNLAAQTAKATEEIGEQISNMQTTTKDAVEAIGGIRETVTNISDAAGAIAAAIEEQTATTGEISRNVQEASGATAEVASNITEVTKATNDTGEASGRVLTAANDMSSQSDTLQGAVEQFLKNIRSA